MYLPYLPPLTEWISRMRLFALLTVCLFSGLVGCGGAADGLQAVHGTVTFDGEPIEKGRILLRQTTGDQKAYAAEIANGRFELRAEEGPTSVEIRASRIIPGKFDHSNGVPEPVGEMYIPAKYNSKTELTADITSGTNELQFDLSSK